MGSSSSPQFLGVNNKNSNKQIHLKLLTPPTRLASLFWYLGRSMGSIEIDGSSPKNSATNPSTEFLLRFDSMLGIQVFWARAPCGRNKGWLKSKATQALSNFVRIRRHCRCSSWVDNDKVGWMGYADGKLLGNS